MRNIPPLNKPSFTLKCLIYLWQTWRLSRSWWPSLWPPAAAEGERSGYFYNLKETYVKTHWWKATQLQWVQLFSCKIQLSEDACWMFAHKIDICSYSYMQVQLAWRCIFKGFPQKRGLTPMLKNPTQNIWSVAEVLAFYENKLTKRWQTIDTWDN